MLADRGPRHTPSLAGPTGLVLVIDDEPAWLALLKHQNAQDLAMMDDRDAEKGLERFFADAIDELVIWMCLSILNVYRLFSLSNQANQAFSL